MRTRLLMPTALAGAAILLASVLLPALAKGPGDESATLRLAIADPPDRQSDPAAHYLVERVAELTEGSLIIEPTFAAGDGIGPGFEEAVAGLVMSGDADLAMIGARAWPLAGITSLQGIQAPFLVDSNALALEVAGSDIAAKALAGMGHGVTGLVMWPEDLRHYMAFGPGGSSFDTVGGLARATLLVITSPLAERTVETLGGALYREGEATGDLTGDRGADSDSGALKGMLTGLWGAGLPRQDVLVAGDVVPEPKFQTLVANDAALAGLTDEHRAALIQAATDMRDDAFTRQFSEADLAAALCAEGATVVVAGVDAVAGFQAAVAPVIAELETDAFTRQVIAHIRVLKDRIPTSSEPVTCTPSLSDQSTQYPMPDTAGFVGTLPPDGSYRAELIESELIAAGATAAFARLNAGPTTWSFQDGVATLEADNFDGRHRCQAPITSIDGEAFRLGPSVGNCGIAGDMLWQPTPDGIRLLVLPPADGSWPVQDYVDYLVSIQQEWVRIK